MADPSKVLYRLPDETIEEIKISPGIMLIMQKRQDGLLPLLVRCIETGQVLSEFSQSIEPGKKINIVEQFNEKLILKQEDEPLRIVDLLTQSVVQVPNARFRDPSAFIFLYEYNTFLAFEHDKVTVWDFNGSLVRQFENHNLFFPYAGIDHTSVIYITQAQDVIISMCRDVLESEAGSSNQVSIHVSSILTGRCLAELDQNKGDGPKISALGYNEHYGDIITGDEDGYLQIWSN